MQAILNGTMASDGQGKLFDRRKAEQIITSFFAHFLVDASLRSNHADGLQAFLLLLRVQWSSTRGLPAAHDPFRHIALLVPLHRIPLQRLFQCSRKCQK
jgi:hypothetical protein